MTRQSEKLGRRKRRNGKCWAAAKARARQARHRGMSPVLIWLLFVWWVLSGPVRGLPVRVLRGSQPQPANRKFEERPCDWPVSDYERGAPGHLRPRRAGGGRYSTRPSLMRLMKDLRRPAARTEAASVLLARIPEADVREWVKERLAEDEISRLSVRVRAGWPEEDIFAAWRADMQRDAELSDDEARDIALDLDDLSRFAGFRRAAVQGDRITKNSLSPRR